MSHTEGLTADGRSEITDYFVMVKLIRANEVVSPCYVDLVDSLGHADCSREVSEVNEV